ncbi:Uma2 family endonuclease [Larkinella rosea]|uniref:Uma2 family endonuclease n=1 Tax=Larkinella rosea TaxID=2025312 RepID=A0A3P1BZ38_9BACT|nr:Uma2 family endonuclease [Larkinella rosea]RRB06390.1 Uma2 family endonuclease [Larkinella rosea]
MAETALTTPTETAARNIPASLIYETLNGRPLYRKGYKEVLANLKTPEEIMGSIDLQAIIVSVLHGFLFNKINRKKYLLTTSESGLHIANGNNLSNDIAIFDKEKVIIKGKYFDIPPKIVVEVDVKIDLEEFPARELDYFYEKTDRMLDFGVEKVIWITTKSRKIFTASRSAPWLTENWDTDVVVVENCVLNMARLLKEEEIVF